MYVVRLNAPQRCAWQQQQQQQQQKALPPRNWQASDPVKGPDKYHLSAGLPLNVYTHVKLERDKIVGKQIMTVRENSSSTLWNWNLR